MFVSVSCVLICPACVTLACRIVVHQKHRGKNARKKGQPVYDAEDSTTYRQARSIWSGFTHLLQSSRSHYINIENIFEFYVQYCQWILLRTAGPAPKVKCVSTPGFEPEWTHLFSKRTRYYCAVMGGKLDMETWNSCLWEAIPVLRFASVRPWHLSTMSENKKN